MSSASEPEQIQSLREAVRLSPENPPLRQALADALLGAALPAQAVIDYRATLTLASDILNFDEAILER